MTEIKKYNYTSIFGEEYEISYYGRLDKTGDFEAVGFTVVEKKLNSENTFDVVIKISGTLLSVWGLRVEEIENLLFELGLLKTFLLAENNELVSERQEFMFSTYGISENAEIEKGNLNKQLQELREEHKKWIENTRKSYFTNSDLILKIQKEHAEFQGSNAKELRSSMLQLSSISGAIIGAVVALSSNGAGQNWFILVSLIFLSISTGLPFIYTTTITQNIIIGTFKKFKSITSKLEEIKESEFNFIRNQSIPNYRNTEDLWKTHSNDIKENMNEITEIKKDKMLAFIQICFTLGIIFLILSFIFNNFNKNNLSSNIKTPEQNFNNSKLEIVGDKK